MIWREKRVPLVILAVLLLANVVFFFTYRVQYENRLQDLDSKLKDTQDRLLRVQQSRRSSELQLASYRKVQENLQTLYNDHWSTQSARFTALINEVKKLAVASQLIPRSYSFVHTDEKNAKTSGVGTSVVDISFTVQGTYEQARRLINLLELSPQFVIIDGISLGGGTDKVLSLNLRLKTLFRDASPIRRTAANKEL
jgi:hypothetical protein